MGISLSFSLDLFRDKHAVTYDSRRIAEAAAVYTSNKRGHDFQISYLSRCLEKVYKIIVMIHAAFVMSLAQASAQ